MTFAKPSAIGVGLQYNPEILDWFHFEDMEVDVFEVLLDNLMGPLDGPYLMRPAAREQLEKIRGRGRLLAHSNYGCDFGFAPLEETAAIRRHVPLAKAIGSPWVANHCFYGDNSWLDIWSSPVQFSTAEIERCAARAKAVQEAYGMPLAHENAAYYMPTPGAQMREAEFMARLVERSGTFLHLDLHNIYTNSVNLAGFSCADYLDTIPLDRVIAIHLAGGSWYGGSYHDWHDSKVPEPVWDLLEEVLSRAEPAAVILEFQGQAHHDGTRVLGQSTAQADHDMIAGDLARAREIWNRHKGAPQEMSTMAEQA